MNSLPHRATPKQVFIDGIAQLQSPFASTKPSFFQQIPPRPDFDQEAKDALEYEGLPPLEPRNRVSGSGTTVVFKNVSSVWQKDRTIEGNVGVVALFEAKDSQLADVLVIGGKIECIGLPGACFSLHQLGSKPSVVVDLEGGSLAPGLTSFGAHLGSVEIAAEPSTNDGAVYDAFSENGIPKVVGGEESVIYALDGISFGGRDMLYVLPSISITDLFERSHICLP
jgi:hypothetical protein